MNSVSLIQRLHQHRNVGERQSAQPAPRRLAGQLRQHFAIGQGSIWRSSTTFMPRSTSGWPPWKGTRARPFPAMPRKITRESRRRRGRQDTGGTWTGRGAN